MKHLLQVRQTLYATGRNRVVGQLHSEIFSRYWRGSRFLCAVLQTNAEPTWALATKGVAPALAQAILQAVANQHAAPSETLQQGLWTNGHKQGEKKHGAATHGQSVER